MPKTTLIDKDLISIINSAIAERWGHENHHCLVASLKKAGLSTRNWDLDQYHSGGSSLSYCEECQEIIGEIVEIVSRQYDVEWTMENA